MQRGQRGRWRYGEAPSSPARFSPPHRTGCCTTPSSALNRISASILRQYRFNVLTTIKHSNNLGRAVYHAIEYDMWTGRHCPETPLTGDPPALRHAIFLQTDTLQRS